MSPGGFKAQVHREKSGRQEEALDRKGAVERADTKQGLKLFPKAIGTKTPHSRLGKALESPMFVGSGNL